jgi:hypothetical protein
LYRQDLTSSDVAELGFVVERVWSPDTLSLPLPSAPPSDTCALLHLEVCHMNFLILTHEQLIYLTALLVLLTIGSASLAQKIRDALYPYFAIADR